MFTTLILYFLIYNFVTYIFYLVGFFALKILKINLQGDFTNAFFSLLIGLTFSISIYAVWMTKFQTVMISNIMVWLIFWFFNTENMKSTKNVIVVGQSFGKINVFICCTFLQILAFSWCFYMVTSANSSFFKTPHPDLFHYAKISDYLGVLGKENTFHINNLLNEYLIPKKPYHYFELWLTNLITKPFQLNSLQTLLNITTPLFLTITIIAYLAFWEKYGKITISKIFLSFLFLFLGGVTCSIYENINILRYIETYSSTFMMQAWKYGPYYLFICGFIIAMIHKEFLLAITLLLSLSVATIAAAPAVFGGLILSVIIILLIGYKKLEIKKIQIYQSILMIFSVIILFLFVYLFNNQTTQIQESTSSFDTKNISRSLNVRTSVNIVLGTIINIIVAYLPLVAFLGFFVFIKKDFLKQEYISNLVILLSVSFAALLAWSLVIPYSVDANQLFLLVSSVIFNVLLVFYLIRFLSLSFTNIYIKGLVVIFTMVFLLHNAYTNTTKNFFYDSTNIYSDKYLNEIKYIIEVNNHLKIGGILLGREDYNTIFMKTTTTSGRGVYLGFMNNNMIAVSMSDYEIPISTDSVLAKKEMNGVSGGSFYQFVQNQKKEKLFESITKSKLDFIKKYNVGYLIVSDKAVIEDTIQAHFSIVIEDSLSKEKFILLK